MGGPRFWKMDEVGFKRGNTEAARRDPGVDLMDFRGDDEHVEGYQIGDGC